MHRSSRALVALVVLSALAAAQNGTNYHALSNGLDITIAGVGAGSSQTASDGIGLYIPGEDLRGATRAAAGHFAYKQAGFTEQVCIPKPASGGQLTVGYGSLVWYELYGDGAANTAHDPIVFPNPVDASCTGFPLGGTAGFVAFGVPAGSSASFLAAAIPSTFGGIALLPNEGILPTALGGQAALLGAAFPSPVPISSSGFCWTSQFSWVPSALPAMHDSTNGWWHWAANNPLGNQYWGMSGDELNVWKSHTVASDAGLTALIPFVADVEYATVMTSVQPNTNLTTWPTTSFGASPYGTNTGNVVDQDGVAAANPYGGYDLGGHGTLSLTGESGVPSINTGVSPQDADGVGGLAPSGAALTTPTLGFHTYDSTSGAGPGGSKRIVWLSFDFDHAAGVSPRASAELLVAGGTVRVPVPVPSLGGPFPQPLTEVGLMLFGHETSLCGGCSAQDPLGLFSFGAVVPQGASAQIQLPAIANLCVLGTPLPITYGSSALAGPTGVGQPAGGLVWNQDLGATSGTKTFFLFE